MRGAILPLPQYVFLAWCLVKQRDNFTFTFYCVEASGQFHTPAALPQVKSHGTKWLEVWNTNVHNRVHNSPSLISNLKNMTPHEF
jgi:hypothetical protein